ncbi:MAG TPA: hypothetical protein VND93_15725 [Myxococcales bacterium]|nr:hypothetical protein [Myxococcales bacterium]
MISGAAGAAGLTLTLVGFFADRRAASLSYLLAFAYWTGLAVAALLWLAVFHASSARWMTVLRRALEAFTLSLPALAVLFIPVALTLQDAFPWVHPDPHRFSPEQLEMLENKAAYLNVPMFLARTAGYFAIWIAASELMARWSRRQDAEGAPVLLANMRAVGTAAVPLGGLAITFAGFDWLMSLDPLWASTIFGAYYFSGSFLAAMCLLTIITTLARRDGLFGKLVKLDHFHSMGKLMLAFTAFWAYIAFSQFMLIWAANLPEENVWYLERTVGGWKVIASALIAGHFVLPFFLLLSRDLKYRPRLLSAVGAWQLLMHLLDLYWIVAGASGSSPAPHWTVLTAFAGVGGVAVAVALYRARGMHTLPLKDPFLEESLRYAQP